MGSYLAVYGTLKSGERNHHWLRGSVFIGLGITVKKYPLTESPYGDYPFLYDDPGIGNRVEVEIFFVEDSIFKSLDLHEGVHVGCYYRDKIDVEFNDVIFDCQCYFCCDRDGYWGLELLDAWYGESFREEV